MQVEVTREAARRIRQRGGELYIWQEPVGHAWASDETSFDRPDGVPFRQSWEAGVEIFVGEDVRASHVRVESNWWPWGGVKVYVDSKRWGRRGRVSETGFDLGGAGPG